MDPESSVEWLLSSMSSTVSLVGMVSASSFEAQPMRIDFLAEVASVLKPSSALSSRSIAARSNAPGSMKEQPLPPPGTGITQCTEVRTTAAIQQKMYLLRVQYSALRYVKVCLCIMANVSGWQAYNTRK